MLTLATQGRLAAVVQKIAQGEVQIERARRVLADQQLFEPSTAFKRIDQKRVGQLELNDLIEFLEDNRIAYTNTEAAYLFKKLDEDRDGRISYQDFQKSVLPKTHLQLKQQAILRQPYQIDVGMLLPTEIELAIAAFLSQQLQTYRQVNQAKQNLVAQLDYNSLEAFKVIDLFYQGYLTMASLETYQKAHGFPLTQDELVAFFKGVDLDEDGRISYHELIEAVHLMEPLNYFNDVIIRANEMEKAIEKSRALERIILPQYPYYFYPYYPHIYPSYFPYLHLNEMRVRENSLDRLRKTRLGQVEYEKQYADQNNQLQTSLQRQRSLERIQQIEAEHENRKSQINDFDKVRELDRLRNEELKKSREVIRYIENDFNNQQNLVHSHIMNVNKESRLVALDIENIARAQQDLRARQIAEENRARLIAEENRARLIAEENRARQIAQESRLASAVAQEARYKSIERLNSVERLAHYNDTIKKTQAQNLLLSQLSQSQRYPYTIMDSINAFGQRGSSIKKSTVLTKSTIYESPLKQSNPFTHVRQPSQPQVAPKTVNSKVTFESQIGARKALY